MASKTVEDMLENIRRSLPNREMVQVPEGASILEQIQILQQLALASPTNRESKTDNIRRSVREEYAERDQRRGRYTRAAEVMNDLEENKRERRKMLFEQERSDQELVAELETLERKRAIKDRRKKLDSRKQEYSSSVATYVLSLQFTLFQFLYKHFSTSAPSEWQKRQEEKEKLRKEIREKEAFETQAAITAEMKAAEREKIRTERRREEQRLQLERERREQVG